MKNWQFVVLPIFIVLSLLIFFNNNFPPVRFITSQIQSFFAGPKSIVYKLTTDIDPQSNLEKENAILRKKLLDFQKMKKDNEALRSQFNTQKTSQFTLMPAKILGFEGSSQNPTYLIIDHGSKNNVHSGMAVIVGDTLVGKIDEVSENYSRVLLSTNVNFKTLAKTSDTGAAGVAEGNEDFILFDKVSVNETVNKNSFLLSAGDVTNEGIGVPPDLVIGKIVSINRSPNLPFQTAKVDFPLDFLRLETVFIVEKF